MGGSEKWAQTPRPAPANAFSLALEGYTLAGAPYGAPAARVRNNSDSKQEIIRCYCISYLFILHPLHWAIHPLETPPLVYLCMLRLRLGVMGNAGLCSHSAHSPFFAHFHHIHSFSTSISPHHGDPQKAGVM